MLLEYLKKNSSRIPERSLTWAIVFGMVGGICGFTTPGIFDPTTVQGPMLGFISGPIAFVLGGLLGAFSSFANLPNRVNRYALAICAVVVASSIFYLSAPEPKYLGYIVDAEVRDCKPLDSVDTATLFPHWDGVIARYGYTPKPNWKADVPNMLKNDNGVILSLFVFRTKKIYDRWPWNRGNAFATEWVTYNSIINFYDHSLGTSCNGYAGRARKFYYPRGGGDYVQVIKTKEGGKYATGPNSVSDFLRLSVLEPVPLNLQGL